MSHLGLRYTLYRITIQEKSKKVKTVTHADYPNHDETFLLLRRSPHGRDVSRCALKRDGSLGRRGRILWAHAQHELKGSDPSDSERRTGLPRTNWTPNPEVPSLFLKRGQIPPTLRSCFARRASLRNPTPSLYRKGWRTAPSSNTRHPTPDNRQPTTENRQPLGTHLAL